MSAMSTLLSIVLPTTLIVGVFLLRPIRSWLERTGHRAEMRSKYIDDYHSSAMFFLKHTDAYEHKETREMIVSIGDLMMDGTKLVRMLLFYARRKPQPSASEAPRISREIGSLSFEARKALTTAMASALLVSTFQSLFFGRAYRSILMLVLSEGGTEVKEPEQFVDRLSQMGGFWRTA